MQARWPCVLVSIVVSNMSVSLQASVSLNGGIWREYVIFADKTFITYPHRRGIRSVLHGVSDLSLSDNP